jgi:hypothetical protein
MVRSNSVRVAAGACGEALARARAVFLTRAAISASIYSHNLRIVHVKEDGS